MGIAISSKQPPLFFQIIILLSTLSIIVFLCSNLENGFSLLAFTLRLLIFSLCVFFVFVFVLDCCFVFPKTFLRQKYFLIEETSGNVKSPVLDRFPIYQGSQNRPLERHFPPKNLKKRAAPNAGERPGADLGATWRRKRPKMIQESIFDGFWSYFGSFWLHFWSILADLG